MKVYKFSTTGLYIGETEAEESPHEKGKYVVPADATPIPPPSCGDGECLVFRDGAWEVHGIDGGNFLEEEIFGVAGNDDEEKLIARHNLSIIVEIIEIETLEQHRAIRDFALTGDRSRLEQIEGRIGELRRQLL